MELRLVMLCAMALVKGAISAVTFEHEVTGLVVRTMSAESVAEQHLWKFDTWFPGGSFMNYKDENAAEKGETSKCAMWCDTTGCDMCQLDAHHQVRDAHRRGEVRLLCQRLWLWPWACWAVLGEVCHQHPIMAGGLYPGRSGLCGQGVSWSTSWPIRSTTGSSGDGGV